MQNPQAGSEQRYHVDEDTKTELYVSTDIIFFVEHHPNVFNGDDATVKSLLDALPDGYELLPELDRNTIQEVSVVQLPATAESRHSLFCVRAESLSPTDIHDNFYSLDSEGQGIPLKEGKGVIRHVMLNRFNGSAPHTTIGPHGPGGPPRAVTDEARLKNLGFGVEYDPDPEGAFKLLDLDAETVVYILDTIPAKERIEDALENFPALGDHFEKILPPVSVNAWAPSRADEYQTEKATYVYMGLHDLPLKNAADKNYAPGKHDYDSSDHGLFIAGIVHSIAPQAKIYVIRVMGPLGVGTIMDFADGFRKVAEIHQQRHPGAHAIVNCSFTLSIPIDGHEQSDNSRVINAYNHPGFRPQIEALMKAINATKITDAVVLAASGNDSDPALYKKARYPAQFESVTGVGAVKKNSTILADYSNDADQPLCAGIYAFGGDYDHKKAKPLTGDYSDRGEGIISIFTGDLDIPVIEDSEAHAAAHGAEHTEGHAAGQTGGHAATPARAFYNPTGYAEWKGTSFATPVIAGMVALLCSKNNLTPAEALALIRTECDTSTGRQILKKIDQKF